MFIGKQEDVIKLPVFNRNCIVPGCLGNLTTMFYVYCIYLYQKELYKIKTTEIFKYTRVIDVCP